MAFARRKFPLFVASAFAIASNAACFAASLIFCTQYFGFIPFGILFKSRACSKLTVQPFPIRCVNKLLARAHSFLNVPGEVLSLFESLFELDDVLIDVSHNFVGCLTPSVCSSKQLLPGTAVRWKI